MGNNELGWPKRGHAACMYTLPTIYDVHSVIDYVIQQLSV